MDPAVIAFGAALLGAVAGAIATAFFQVRDSRRLGKGAGRALYMELAYNASVAQQQATGSAPPIPFTRTTWDVEQSRVALLLPPPAFRIVAIAYIAFPAYQMTLDQIRARGAMTSDNLGVLQLAARDFHAAVEALAPFVWTAQERLELTSNAP